VTIRKVFLSTSVADEKNHAVAVIHSRPHNSLYFSLLASKAAIYGSMLASKFLSVRSNGDL